MKRTPADNKKAYIRAYGRAQSRLKRRYPKLFATYLEEELEVENA